MNEQMLVDILSFLAGVTAIVSVARLIAMVINRKKVTGLDPKPFEERLTRIEQIVESTAIEMERVSEAQRFTARVLTERSGAQVPAASPAPGRSTTPH